MTASYQHLALADVVPGMILSDVLFDAQGHVLLPRGAVLTETILAAMLHHGIDMLPILCSEVSEADETAELGARRRRLAKLFRKNDLDRESDWATGLLRHYVEHFRLGAKEQK